jgi:hypothetical protein
VGRGLRGRDHGGNVNNVQYKSNQNCHCNSPPCNEYVLIKILFKKDGDRRVRKVRLEEERRRARVECASRMNILSK